MQSSTPRLLRAAWRASVLSWLIAAGGCGAFVFHPGDEAAPDAVPDASRSDPRRPAERDGADQAPAAGSTAAPPESVSREAPVGVAAASPSAPGSPDASPAAPLETPSSPRVAVLASPLPAHAELAATLRKTLAAAGYRVEPVEPGRDGSANGPAPHRDELPAFAVAVGAEAAFAARELAIPTIFCQVFNHDELSGGDAALWGVSAIPPLALQLRTWKRIDPSLGRVGLIVGAGQTALAHDAERAARRAGIALRTATSSSDRETIYHFRRLVREIDGFWLFPDNRILSPTAIHEILTQASAHGVRIVAVNTALPPGAALMTASASEEDIAAAVRDVLNRLVHGDPRDLPRIAPLSAVLVQIDERAAARHGIDVPDAARKVVRD